MNKCILIGNLVADPESKTLQSGIAYCTFRLAVQRRYASQGGEKVADFLTVVCWRQLAELCAKYLAKGRKVAVEGSIQTRTYDAQDGSKRYATEIVADSVEFLGSKSEGANADAGAHASVEIAREQAKAAMRSEDVKNGFTEVDDDELPF